MNPWKQTLLLVLRDILRFSLWLVVVIDGLMIGVFSIAFCYQLLTHTWNWLMRRVFSGNW